MLKSLKKRLFKVNKSAAPILIQCRVAVDKEAVSRTSIGGIEHIIVSSATLPDNVIMNDGLYPSHGI